jgi:hypothetical protein
MREIWKWPLPVVILLPVLMVVAAAVGWHCTTLVPFNPLELQNRDAIELVKHCLVEVLDDAVGLRALCLGPSVIDVLDSQVEFVFVTIMGTAVLVPRSVRMRAAGVYRFPRRRERPCH